MQKIFIITFLLALSVSLTAQQPGVHADVNAIAEGEIKALELKLAELIVHGDWDEYAKHLASDYLHTRDNGHVEGKDEALAALRDVKRKVIVMEMEPADLAVISTATPQLLMRSLRSGFGTPGKSKAASSA